MSGAPRDADSSFCAKQFVDRNFSLAEPPHFATHFFENVFLLAAFRSRAEDEHSRLGRADAIRADEIRKPAFFPHFEKKSARHSAEQFFD